MKISRRQAISGMSGAICLNAFNALKAQNISGLQLKAFVVGVDRYASLNDLERAVLDAESIAEKLVSIGYEVNLVRNVSTSDFFESYNVFVENLSSDDAVFVYFAGHGLQYNGVNYLIPSDADGSDGDMLLATSIPLPSLLDGIAGSKPKQSIAVIDACRNEPLKVNIDGLARGFTSTTAPSGFFVAYSAGTGQFAIDKLGDDDCHKNGLFTRSFLNHMDADAPISDIVKLTRAEVSNSARQINRSQNPAYYDQSHFEYRLDGQRTSALGRPSIKLGGLEGAAALVVAVQDYEKFSDLPSLQTPREDGQRIGGFFSEMGAETIYLNQPTKTELLSACKKIAASKPSQTLVHLAGIGGLVNDDAHLFLPIGKSGSQQKGETRTATFPDTKNALPKGLEMVSAFEIAKALTPNNGNTEKPAPGTTRGIKFVNGRNNQINDLKQSGNHPVLIFFDACLDDLDIAVVGPKKPSLLKQIKSSSFEHVAFLASAGYYQTAADTAPGESSSPFTIALTNAMARPGLTIRQYAGHIRSEVENLTNGRQTPRLFLGSAVTNMVPVTQDIDEANISNCR